MSERPSFYEALDEVFAGQLTRPSIGRVRSIARRHGRDEADMKNAVDEVVLMARNPERRAHTERLHALASELAFRGFK